MRYFICLLVSAAVFYACSGDDGSSVNENEGYSENSGFQYVNVDKDNHVVMIRTEATTKAYCVLNKGAFTWSELSYPSYDEMDPSIYETRGDTLVVYFNGNTDDPHYYIGGSTEKIYGKWKKLECGEYNGKLLCLDDDIREFDEQYSETILTISENKFQEEVVYKPAYFKNDDYMNSMFVHYLYGSIQNGEIVGGTVSLKDLLEPAQESYIKNDEEMLDIEVLESSKTEKKFKMKDKEFVFKVTKAERDSLDYTLAVSLTSGDKGCSYEERQVNVTKDNCKDLTTDGLRNYDEDRDSKDSLYIRGTVLYTKGAREFGECLAGLSH